MRNKVTYEWCYEIIDGHGDIMDHHFGDTLEQLKNATTPHLVLVRHEGNEAQGEVDRSWAYAVDGRLPEFFSDAYDKPTYMVPQRFHAELLRYLRLTDEA